MNDDYLVEKIREAKRSGISYLSIEKDLGFSNGCINKFCTRRAGMSNNRKNKLLVYLSERTGDIHNVSDIKTEFMSVARYCRINKITPIELMNTHRDFMLLLKKY